ncbi:MAG: multidrug resistance protein MdtH [Methanocella sp. PtaU1.Bin125]|nr:MAG: multidrug resistance protein MdtH [Methanocella sp. PtaU1.Bin125]
MSRLIQRLRNKKWSIYDRQVWILFAGTIINTVGGTMVMPFMSIYMYTQMDVSMTMVGLAFFIGTVMGAVASCVGGMVCDRFGRKSIFIAGLTMQVAALLLISVAIDAKVSYWPMVAVLAIGQIIDGLYRPVPDIMIADVVEPGRRIGAYGLIRVGGNIGAVIGPVLGGALALVAMSYSSMFYIAALTTLVFLLVVIYWLRDTKPSDTCNTVRLKEIARIAGDRPFLLVCLIIMLLIIPYSQMYALMSVYCNAYLGMNTLEVGGIFAVSGIMVAIFQFPITMLIGRYRMTSMLALASLVFALGFGLVAVSATLAMMYLCMVIITIAEMIWVPSDSTLKANLAPADRRGQYFGFAGLVSATGYAIGPLFGGVLKDTLNSNVPFMWVAIGAIFLVSMAGFLLLTRMIPAATNNDRRTGGRSGLAAGNA